MNSAIKQLFCLLLALAVVVGNYYGFYWALKGLTYPSDASFVVSMFGVVLMAFIDVQLVLLVIRKVRREKAS